MRNGRPALPGAHRVRPRGGIQRILPHVGGDSPPESPPGKERTMYVGRRMTREVIALSPKDTVRDANRILEENRIHHLPVVEGEELVGIVSDTDIRKWILREEMVHEEGTASRRTGSVEEIMSRDVSTVSA